MIAIMSGTFVDELSKLAERQRELAAGETLFRTGDAVLSLFLVAAGEMRLARMLPHGQQLVLQRAGRGEILAEASLFADKYHCDAIASEPSRLHVVRRARIVRAFDDDPALLLACTRHLALEVQRTRARAETLSLRRVAARLDAWMDINGGGLPPKGRWRDIAREIGVTPEALYREIARRRSDGPALRRPVSNVPPT